MSARLLAASIIAALTLTTGAKAADLYGENYYRPRDASPYDDPRFADRDRYPPPPASYEGDGKSGQFDEYYDERDYADRYPDADRDDDRAYEGDAYRGSTKDGYPVPVPPPRFADRTYGPYGGGCMPRWQIRHRLRAEGWTNLRPLERGGDTATVRARRQDSGRVFMLRVDRCTGEVVHARPHYLREFGAYSPRPWRRGSPY